MKTLFALNRSVRRLTPAAQLLMVLAVCTGHATARKAWAQDISSVVARSIASSALGSGTIVDRGVARADYTADASSQPYPMSSDGNWGNEWDPGMGWGDCPGGCPPSCRGRAEWLEFTRNRSGDSLTNAFPFNDFGYERGIRATVDFRWDCTHGWEVIYAGLFDWEQVTFATGLGTLNTVLAEGAGIDLSAFQTADAQTQLYQSELHSLESLYKCWGWDVIAVGWGGRYINLNEQLFFRSDDNTGDVGIIRSDATNHLLLGEVAIDMLFPLGRWSFDSTWKFALGTNVGDNVVFISNAGVPQVNHKDRDFEFAAMIEGGAYLRYFVTSRLAIRYGYEFWYIYGVGLAPNQLDPVVSTFSGRDFRGEDDVLVHGGSIGVEFGW